MSLVETLIQVALAAPDDRKKEALRILRGENPSTGLRAGGNMQSGPEEYLTLRACAKRLGFAACSLWRWKVPGHSLGGRPRFRVSEVEKYLNSDEFKARVVELREDRYRKLAEKEKQAAAAHSRTGRKKKGA